MSATIKLVPQRVWARVHSRNVMIVILKDLEAPPRPPRETDLRVEDVARHHLPALSELNRERGLPNVDARFGADIDAGYGGFVALRDDRLVAFYWWVDRDAPPPASRSSIAAAIDELGLELQLGPGDVYGADLYVGERDRSRNTAQAFLDQVEQALRERGYGKLWGYVQENNRLARWTYSLRGYQPMWRVIQTKTLGRRRSWTESSTKES